MLYFRQIHIILDLNLTILLDIAQAVARRHSDSVGSGGGIGMSYFLATTFATIAKVPTEGYIVPSGGRAQGDCAANASTAWCVQRQRADRLYTSLAGVILNGDLLCRILRVCAVAGDNA